MRLYTVQEVAEILRVHPDTVRRRIKAKTLKAGRTGGPKTPWRISDAEVKRVMAAASEPEGAA